MRSFIKLIIITMFMTPSFSFAGKEGGGAELSELTQKVLERKLKSREKLSRQNIKDLLDKAGDTLRRLEILPLMNKFLRSELLEYSDHLKEMRAEFLNRQQELIESVKIAPIYLGKCSHGNESCVKSEKVFDPIYVDLENIMKNKNGITLAEFLGIMLHEYSHKFVGHMDHPEYELAEWGMDRVKADDYKTRTFSLFDPQNLLVVEVENKKYLLLSSASPERFCRSKGFAISFDDENEKVERGGVYIGSDIRPSRFMEELTELTGAEETKGVTDEKVAGHYTNKHIITSFMLEHEIHSKIKCGY